MSPYEPSVAQRPDLDERIVAAGRAIREDIDPQHPQARPATGFVPLFILRSELEDVPRAELDAALIRMYREHRIGLMHQFHGLPVTAEDHAAAVIVDERPRHQIRVDRHDGLPYGRSGGDG